MCKEEDEVGDNKDVVHIEEKLMDNKSNKYPEPGNCPIPRDQLIVIPYHAAGIQQDPLRIKKMDAFEDLPISDA